MRAFMSWLRIEVKGHLTQSLVVEPQFCQKIQQFPLEKKLSKHPQYGIERMGFWNRHHKPIQNPSSSRRGE